MSKIKLYDGSIIPVKETFKELSAKIAYRGDSEWFILHHVNGAEFAVNTRYILMIRSIEE